jgi:hypothetical protein
MEDLVKTLNKVSDDSAAVETFDEKGLIAREVASRWWSQQLDNDFQSLDPHRRIMGEKKSLQGSDPLSDVLRTGE